MKTLRIIAGIYKGRKLVNFNADNIRPTSDMVKGAIFNKLQNIAGLSFLDLFGGTGNVGYEALSRGANPVYICDNNANSVEIINKNNALFNNGAKVIKGDFLLVLENFSKNNVKFDIIFIDPPYSKGFGIKSINKIKELKLLNDNGIIIYEHNKTDNLQCDGFNISGIKQYGIKEVVYLKGDND